jgi:hypothetical protein
VVSDLGLERKREATRLTPTSEGVAFLGYRVFGGALHLQARDRRRFGRAVAREARRLVRCRSETTRDGRGRLVRARARAAIATRLQHAAFATTQTWRRALVTRLGLL